MIGQELIVDFIGCDKKILQNKEMLERIILGSVKNAKAKVINKKFHKFYTGGRGITGYILLAESHVSIHTYPEINYAALDIFACGRLDARGILNSIAKHLPHRTIKIKRLNRG